MKITVILCTYNRCETLSRALESVAATTFSDPVEWEVLVVDNNSKDQTRDVIECYCRRYSGRFRYLFEGRQGKSHALNAAIRSAQGDVLAFMDDDVTVDPRWLQNLTNVLNVGEWVGVGGRILPPPHFSPPSWLAMEGRYSMKGVLALFDLGDKAGELRKAPFGTNMAFLKKMFELHGGFRTDIGPSPGDQIRNEDTEFGHRLMGHGHRLWYEPSAVVCHPVQQDRLNRGYFLAWWFDYGRALIREKGKGLPVLGIPRHHISIPKMICTSLVGRTLKWICTSNSQRRFFRKCWAWSLAGQITETYHLYRETKKRVSDVMPE